METRERFIEVATRLFADKGFYGVSMDRIARELDLTKQALIHHFGTKEKLYGQVLAGISDRLLEDLDGMPSAATATSDPPFVRAAMRLLQQTLARQHDTQLLMRELLDNPQRAAKAGTWYLRSFIEQLLGLLQQDPRWREADKTLAGTHVYQVLGAINYFAVSLATLENMYSARHVQAMRKAYPERLRTLASAAP